MSMFRRPGDSSSSDDESSEDREEETSQDDTNILSRINTLDSGRSGGQSGHQTPSSRPALSRDNSGFRDLILHSLLEDKALREAAEHLGRDRSDPEVQQLARTAYQALSRQMATSIDEKYASDEMRAHRTTAQDGINAATRSYLTGLPAAPTGDSQALVPLGLPHGISPKGPPSLDSLFGISSPIDIPLQGYPGLHTDRYVREFTQLDLVGKGGYGKVFKVKHNLDNSFYAVKRIMVSPTRLQKIQEHGPQEMETLLEEVRSLARFDHGNIVRYHNAWLEFTRDGDVPAHLTNFQRARRYIQDNSASSFDNADGVHAGFSGMSLDDPLHSTNQDSAANIIFETSDASAGAEEYDLSQANGTSKSHLRAPENKQRRGSQASQASLATVATVSSTRSHMSAIEDADEEEEEVENIPRTHLPYAHDSTSDLSQSMLSHSDIPGHMVSARPVGPVLTLNVQMSLYDTNLAAFLSAEQASFSADPQLHHCFHPCISLELLSNVISGVEYLHAQGVVHRDLKPANVFLSISTSRLPPSGSVDLSTCKPCPARGYVHITPRIGDFGLVAVLGDKCRGAGTVTKPVGTEFYRPEGGDSRISEKLDVFALGVVGFEMLNSFGTRMERVDALMHLRRGQFPDDFAERIGVHGGRVKDMISRMVDANEEERWTCERVKEELGSIIQALKTLSSEGQ